MHVAPSEDGSPDEDGFDGGEDQSEQPLQHFTSFWKINSC